MASAARRVKSSSFSSTKFEGSYYLWLIFAYLVPVLSGLLARRVQRNKEFGYFCWISSILNPILFIILGNFIFGLFSALFDPSVSNWSDTTWAQMTNEVSFVVILFVGVPINILAISKILKNNSYRYFFPVSWFVILGAGFSYFKIKDKVLRRKMEWFAVCMIFISLIMLALSKS